ncbi:uncharacterized protein LOC128196229 [Vigna angularis]|uniref:uncharacterized protein LOC128196229 n=1 Tax=Phaseolus angularis TaxID=3914 RepID=UPI0022B4291B|nr:uncharacterized protein LOC128196229 [Vigna angularis]
MENWEQSHESIKADVSQLKDQMTQILAALEALKTTGGATPAQVEGSAQYYPPLFNAGSQSVSFPMYGLPPGYTPPMGEYTEGEQTSFSFPTTANVPPISNQGPVVMSAPMVNEGMHANMSDGIRVTPVPPVITGEGFSTRVAPYTSFQGVISNVDGAKDKLESLEVRLRAVEGYESYGFGDVARLSLVPGVKIPHKFKAPDFEKYKGNTCPKSHLTMFCRKMAAYSYDEQLLIHVFQDSLAGVALNCLQLQNMSKKDNETFKKYAQRWRELAAQVEPPLYDREMVAMFVNTLQPPFYEHMVGNVSSNFADIIVIGERIEIGLKNGKIAYGSSVVANSKKPNFNSGKRKEGDVHATSATPVWRGQAPTHNYRPYWGQHPHAANASFGHQIRPQQQPGYYQPQYISTNNWRGGANVGSNMNVGPNTYPRRNQERNYVNFTPIPTTYTELLPHLIKQGLVVVCPLKPLQPPYPRGYDADAKCSYHGGTAGHSTERCLAFKHKVQTLIDSGWLKFQEDKPSIEANPLSGHGSASTNAVEVKEHELVRNVKEVRSSRRFILEALLKVGILKGDYDESMACTLHPDAEHSIEECVEFEEILQDLLDRGLMQNEKAVPWRYGTHASGETQSVDPVVKNISGIGGITRSGLIFTSPELARERVNDKEATMAAKAKEFLKGKGAQTEEIPDKEERREVSEEEACEFLKFIQQSEYKVVEQLNRMPARISLLDLLMHSASHRKLLMKILSEAHVEQGISLNKFEGIVGNIVANNYLTFMDEEIPAEGRGHNKALHVSVKCLDHVIARVLVDNGSSLNVMPKATLEKLPCEGMHMRPSSMIVRAFDGSKREVMGEVELPMQVGPCVFQITFQVMDILPAYSCLLGRPWIHSAGVVPSTLHQKLKYVMGDKLVIVSGEEDLLVSGPSSTRYIEAAEEALETAFQSLEIVGNACVEPFPLNPRLSCASIMMAKIMLKEGYIYGEGLGKYR